MPSKPTGAAGLFADITPQSLFADISPDPDSYEGQLADLGISPQEARRATLQGELDAERAFPEPTEPRSTFDKARNRFAGTAARDSGSVLEALKMLSVGDAPDPQSPGARFRLFQRSMDDPRWMDPAFMAENEPLIRLGVDPVQAAIASESTQAWRRRKGEMDELFRPLQKPLEEAGAAALDVSARTPGNRAVTEVAGGLGSTVPTLVTALTGPASAAAVAGLQSAGFVKKEALEYYRSMGMSDVAAENLANDVARISGLSTAVVTAGAGRLLGREGVEGWARQVAVNRFAKAHPIRHVLKEVFAEAGSEAVEEAADQTLQSMFAMKAHRPDMTWEQVFHESVQAGILGAVSAGLLTAPMAGASLSRFTKAQLSKNVAQMLTEEFNPPSAPTARAALFMDLGPATIEPAPRVFVSPDGERVPEGVVQGPIRLTEEEQATVQRELADLQDETDFEPVIRPGRLTSDEEEAPAPAAPPEAAAPASLAFQPLTSEAAAGRIVWDSTLNPVGPGEGSRWGAIENTYIMAREAERALPGVPLDDVFAVFIRRRVPGVPPSTSPLVDIVFTTRADYPAVRRELEKVYPASGFIDLVQAGLKPYSPRKGEPSYQRWLAGERPVEKPEKPADTDANEQPERVEAGGQPVLGGPPGVAQGAPSGLPDAPVGPGSAGGVSGSVGPKSAGGGGQVEGGRRRRSRSPRESDGQPDRAAAGPGHKPGEAVDQPGVEPPSDVPAPAGESVAPQGATSAEPAPAPVPLGESATQPPAAPPAAPELPEPDRNFTIEPGVDLAPAGAKTKARANLDAYALLLRLERENRNPTAAEKAILARYTGWGSLKELFDHAKARMRQFEPNWERQWGKLYDELREALTPEEYAAANKSILNAHYTSPQIIAGMWSLIRRLGFRGGRVLEPSAGIGHFFGMMPAELAGRSTLHGVELDSVSARILAKLYPQAKVDKTGFETARIPNNSIDLVVGNVPFAKDGPYDPRYPRLSLHNYFFARSLDLLKPGGLVVAITSSSTMDNDASREARRLFAEKADLVGAIRLPNDAFKKNAGTEVTTDILIFRKRDGNAFAGAPFFDTRPVTTPGGRPVTVNEYFAGHPEMMLGDMTLEGTMYGPDQPALKSRPGVDLAQALAEATQRVPEGVFGARPVPVVYGSAGEQADAGAKEGQLVIKDGLPYFVRSGALESAGWSAGAARHAAAYVGLREKARGLIAAQFDHGATDEEVTAQRQALNAAYEAFVAKYGPVNGRRNRFLEDDPEFPLVSALETVETTTVEREIRSGKNKGKTRAVKEERYHKAEILEKRTIYPRMAPTSADTAADAVSISLAYRNVVDLAYVAQLLGTTMDEARQRMLAEGLVFENPWTGVLETPDDYLSGFVKDKLAKARMFAVDNPQYQRNVAALEKVQPARVPIDQVSFRLGSAWLPPEFIERFLDTALDVTADVTYEPLTGTWNVRPKGGQLSAKNTTTYGGEYAGHELVEQALNLSSPVVYDVKRTSDGETRERNPAKTLAMQAKQQQLAEMFERWARATQDVSVKLEDIYNDEFNGVVLRKYAGPNWDYYPGAAETVKLRPHQKAVVTRNLQGSTLLAHGVGTGKTFVLITTAMEMRRLGIARKPMIVVQNATLSQFASSIKRLYPGAKVLAATERMRKPENRKRLLSQIATGDYDAVVVPQSWFNMVPDNAERVEGYIIRRMDELEEAIIKARRVEGARSPKASDLQKAKDRLETRLKKLRDRKVDDVLTFEQLGVDALMVDEAHAYKKLEFDTQMDSVKGLDRGASQRGFSMLMKARFVQERNNGKNVIFATGTPISNTLAEAWTMMRYLRPDVLERYSMSSFDEFAGLFGDRITSMEMTAGGTWKPVTRFARFTNGPELIAAFHTVADVILPEDVKLDNVPTLKNGRPTNVVVPQTPAIADYVDVLRARLDAFDKMSGREKRDNSHIPLVVFGLAKKMSLDMRLIDPAAADHPDSKLNHAAARIKEVWDTSSDVLGTQLVFADSYQSAPSAAEWLDAEGTVRNPSFGKSEFNLYVALKRKLVDLGIPVGEIEIITDLKLDSQREALFRRVNEGKVRVLIGSTEKMGVGVNVQQRLVGLHHLDAPARPMDVEQRNGRILRQGNENAEVEIFTYGVENTLDAAMFQRLATKQKFINQVLRGDLQGRNFEDAANETSMTFEEQMAAFSGDPLTVEKVGVENQVRQLTSLRDSHARSIAQAKEQLNELFSSGVPKARTALVAAQALADDFRQRFAGDLAVSIAGNTVTASDVAPALNGLFEAAVAKAEHALVAGPPSPDKDYRMPIGTILANGAAVDLIAVVPTDLQTGRKRPDQPSYVTWSFKGGPSRVVQTGAGFVSSLRSQLADIQAAPDKRASELEVARRNVTELTGYVQQPFERQAELDSARARLVEIDALLAQRNKEVNEAEERAKKALDEVADSAKDALERLQSGEHFGEVDMLGLSAGFKVVRDLAIVGADLVRRGFASFGAWSGAMVKRFGARVGAFLKTVWDRIQRIQLMQALGLSPESAAHVARIEGQAAVEPADHAPVRPLNDGVADTVWQKIRRRSQRILYFGSPDLLRAKQALDLTESYQAAAVREQSDRLWQMLTDDAYNARPGEFRLPKWMGIGAWATRLRKFRRLALPVAAHLNVTGRGPTGEWVYSPFAMRAGLMTDRQFQRGNHNIGDTILVSNPVTGVMEALEIAGRVDDGKRRGYQLVRNMSADQQAEIYNYYRNEFPELIWALDIYVDPDLAHVRYEAHGVEVPVFNRFALAVKMAENNPGFSPVDAYTPDVLVTRSLLGAVAGALSFRRGTRSPGRKYKTGRSRESGQVRDLFSAFNIRTFQVLQEEARKAWFRAVVREASPIPAGGVPDGYVKLDTGIDEVWNAIRRLRGWRGGGLFPETAGRLMDDGSPEWKAFVGEAAQLRGRQLMLPRPLVDLLVRQYVAQVEHGRLYRMGAWAIRNSTQLFIASPKTYVANVLANDLFALEAAFRNAVGGMLKLIGPQRRLGVRDLRAAGNILGGMALHRFRGLRELLHVADSTRYLQVVREVLPDSVFADATQLADVKVRYDDKPFDLLRRGEIGGALLQAIGYGTIDVRAKQRLAYAYLKADAVSAAKAAGLSGPALRSRVDQFMTNPPDSARARAVAAASFEMLNYADSPEWLDRFSRNDYGRLVLPFPRFGYHFLAKQAARISALRLFLGRVPRGQRADALADIVTVATFGLGGGGLLLHAAVRALFGGDDDDPRQFVGTSAVKYVDEDGAVKSAPLSRELVTSNRVNLSYFFRLLGVDAESDEDFWIRVRQYPPIVMAGAAVVALSDATRFGVSHGVSSYLQTVGDLGSDFFSVGMALKVPDKAVASLRSLESGHAERPLLDPYATRVPFTAYLTEQLMDSFVPGSRQADEVLWWLDPVQRRRTESEQLNFHPGAWHAVRLSHWSGVVDRVLTLASGGESDLLPAGAVRTAPLAPRAGMSTAKRIERLEALATLFEPAAPANVFVQPGQRPRIAYIPERARQPVSLLTRLSSLAGFNVRGVPRVEYEDEIAK